MMDIGKIIEQVGRYSHLANAATAAIAALLQVAQRSSAGSVTEEEIDAEIARIDNEVASASKRDWDRLRGG